MVIYPGEKLVIHFGRLPPMKKTLLLLPLLALCLSPRILSALTNEETEGRKEIEQQWVIRHNEKLADPVKLAVKGIKAKKHAYLLASRKQHLVRMHRISLSRAAHVPIWLNGHETGVPMNQPFPSATPVPLVALYQAKADGLSFLIADYADDYEPILHSSSDIYIKTGRIYRHLFHGEGYRGCARILTLGKGSPLFFEMGVFGGGTNTMKDIYTLNIPAIKAMPDDLYDHPEIIESSSYVTKVLEFDVWLEGFTFYKDVEKNGSLEIINCTRTEYPPDLKKKVQEKYHQVDNDFGGPFRKIATVYKWDAAKSKFEDIGDYFF